jgi:hypothetical protein
VLHQLDSDVEIIVNNDSFDIEEIQHPQVTYHYQRFDNLSMVYKFLLQQAKGEHVYFLEDDDHVVKDFLNIELNADLIAGNYFATYSEQECLSGLTLYRNRQYSTAEEFFFNTNIEYLQLGQYIFRKKCIEDFVFPMNSHIHNDQLLVEHAASRSTSIQTLNKVFYYQTIDGGDNISFPHLAPIKYLHEAIR